MKRPVTVNARCSTDICVRVIIASDPRVRSPGRERRRRTHEPGAAVPCARTVPSPRRRAQTRRGQATALAQTPAAQAGQVLVRGVVGAIDNPQVFPPPALHGGLREAPLATQHEVSGLTTMPSPPLSVSLVHQPMPSASRAGSVTSTVLYGVASNKSGSQRQTLASSQCARRGLCPRGRRPPSPAGGTGPASGRSRTRPTSNIAGRP